MKNLQTIRQIVESLKTGRAVDGVNNKKLVAAAVKFVASDERFIRDIVVRNRAHVFARS